MFSSIHEIQEYINIGRNIDIELLKPYEEEALRYISKIVPTEIHNEIETTQPEAYEQLRKAVANYMMPFALPFLKVHISNIGGNNFDDDKMKKADWWDLRDYALSAIKIADNALSTLVAQLQKTELSNKLTLFDKDYDATNLLFQSPTDFEQIYDIGNSWFVFQKLLPNMEAVWLLYLRGRLKSCTIANLLEDENTKKLLRHIIGYYTLAESVSLSGIVFTTSGIVLQWEQLPWQKSAVIDRKELNQLAELYTDRANRLFAILLDYLRNNIDKFPCYEYSTEIPYRKTIAKKSGLYF